MPSSVVSRAEQIAADIDVGDVVKAGAHAAKQH